MHVQRILCPVELSESSFAALDHAAFLAGKLGAHLHIVNVDETPLLCGAVSSSQSQRLVEQRNRLEDMPLTVRGVSVEHHVLRGRPAEEIVRFARLWAVDLVVMGRATVGRRPGSRVAARDGVIWRVLSECPCPVTVVGSSAAIARLAG